MTESLAGRVGVVRILGLSNSEISGNHFSEFIVNPQELIHRIGYVEAMNISQVFERIFKGSMPRLYEMENVNRSE